MGYIVVSAVSYGVSEWFYKHKYVNSLTQNLSILPTVISAGFLIQSQYKIKNVIAHSKDSSMDLTMMRLHVVTFSILALCEVFLMISVTFYMIPFFSNDLEITISYYLIEIFLFISGLAFLYIMNDLTSKQKRKE